ncbi:MAG: glycoside hydrolase family 3 N-terminal domain-containing protein [Acidobacteriota bacterium]
MDTDLSKLTIRQKIGQMFFIGISGPTIDGPTEQLLDEISPGGVCLFARNIREAEQTRTLLDSLRGRLFHPLLSLDQEGGTVDRLRRLVTPMTAAASVSTVGDAAEMGRLIAATVRMLGFNMDFAPVVDVVDNARKDSSSGLFTRPFGSSKDTVTSLAGEFLRVLQRGGVIGCLKHFPGLGGAKVDSHEELPVVDISRDELFSIDLYPYRELIKNGEVHAVMIAHTSFPAVDLQELGQNGTLLPSSLSKNFITHLLRDELLFDGLVITDDLEMGAIVKNYGIGDACVMAINAGVDMLAICADPINVREGFRAVNAAYQKGTISEERIETSIARIAHIKSIMSDPPCFDTDRLACLSTEISRFNSGLEKR